MNSNAWMRYANWAHYDPIQCEEGAQGFWQCQGELCQNSDTAVA